MIIRRLIVPLTVALVTCHAGQAFAQGAFPAPLPGQAAPTQRFAVSAGQWRGSRRFRRGVPVRFRRRVRRRSRGSAFERGPAPPSQAGGPPDDCMKKFLPLREEAEKRGKLIKAAGDRKATPDEACKLIGNFGQAEIKMIKYVETNSARCGIPPQVADQMKTGHKNTENMQKKVCGVGAAGAAARPGRPEPERSAGLFGRATGGAPPCKKGGSTFDTLNGNVLTR